MNQIDKTREMRAKVISDIDRNSARLQSMRLTFNQLNLPLSTKQHYLDIIDRNLTQLEEVKTKISKRDSNTFKDYMNVQQQASQYVALNKDVKKDMNTIEAFLAKLTGPRQTVPQSNASKLSRTNTATAIPPQATTFYDFPEVPTGYRTPPASTPRTAPVLGLDTVVRINSQLSQSKSDIVSLIQLMPNRTTEDKVKRTATYSSLDKEQKSLQKELDIVGRIVNKTTPLNPLEKAKLRGVDDLERRVSAFNRKISNQIIAQAPKAPTGQLKTSQDEPPRNNRFGR